MHRSTYGDQGSRRSTEAVRPKKPQSMQLQGARKEIRTASVATSKGIANLEKNLINRSADPMQLSEEQIKELREAFSLFDRDGDGTISSEELGFVIRSLGQDPTDEELDSMVTMADADGNGIIDFPEFLTMMSRTLGAQDPDKEINEAWKVFSDGNDFIPPFMVKKILINLGENVDDKQLQELIEEADIDGDGKIGYQDFYETMKIGS